MSLAVASATSSVSLVAALYEGALMIVSVRDLSLELFLWRTVSNSLDRVDNQHHCGQI